MFDAASPATGALTSISEPPYPIGVGGSILGYPPLTLAPGAQFSPAARSFSNTTVGVASTPQMIEFANTGTATLNISAISITGTNAADLTQTNTCAATLSAGASCVLTVVFTPSLSVSDNAAGSPHTAAADRKCEQSVQRRAVGADHGDRWTRPGCDLRSQFHLCLP